MADSVLTMTYNDLEKHFGSASAAADFLGMKRQSVSIWKARGGRIPFEAQYRIQVATKGKLKAVLPKRP